MKYTIQDLKEGRCAVINDGTLDELREVLNKAFPVDKLKTAGHYKFYFSARNGYYNCDYSTSLPTQSVKQFLEGEEDNFVLPEKWCVQRQESNDPIAEYFNKRFKASYATEGCIGLIGCDEMKKTNTWFFRSCFDKNYTEITFEQFQKYVLKENSTKEKQTTMRKIKSSQAQDIINIACNGWKANLAEKWAKKIVLQKEIEITEEFYQEMRKACTDEQNELFDKIFGIESPYKEGELIFVRGRKEDLWKLAIFSRMFDSDRSVTCKCSYTSDNTSVWQYHAPAKGVTLPE